MIAIVVIAAVILTALFATDFRKSGGGGTNPHHFAEGQRWRFKTDVAEFEDTLVIGGVIRLSELPMPPGAQRQKDLYWAYVRVNTSSPGAPRGRDGVPLALTAEELDQNVTGLVAEGVALPEWWRSGKPPEQKDRPQGGGGIRCARVDEALRQFLTHERNLDEGRRLASTGPSIDEIRRKLDPWVRAHARPAWKPVTQDGDGSATASKFAGAPWLAVDEKWPVCQVCGKPLKLFVQLNLDELPPDDTRGNVGKGLLQLFYCTASEDGECDAAAFEPFGKGKLVRLVEPNGPGQAAPQLPRGSLPATRIVDWRRVEDHPNSQEHEELGLSYKFDFQRRTVQIDCPSLGVVFDHVGDDAPEAISDAANGDKLGGWPAWVQGAAYPNCPRCGKRMRFIFQLDSNDNLPFMFGDVGCGQIMQCPDHHDVVTFIWDCS